MSLISLPRARFATLARSVAAVSAAAATFAAPFSASAMPALWKAVGPTGGAVYLFGTVHVLRPDVKWRSPELEKAFSQSSVLWEEIDDADDPQAMQPLMLKYGVDPTHPLSSKIGDAGEKRLATVGAAYGVIPAQIEPLRPWLAGVTFTMLPLVKAGYDPKSGVDVKLKADAAEAKKPLRAFETAEEQIRFFADLPQDREVQFLMSTLDDVEKGPAQFDKLVDAWAAGDVKQLEALTNAEMREKYPDLYRILLVDRNLNMARQIKAQLDSGATVFVAVGAAHLVGPDSVQADLEKMGVKVVRQ